MKRSLVLLVAAGLLVLSLAVVFPGVTPLVSAYSRPTPTPTAGTRTPTPTPTRTPATPTPTSTIPPFRFDVTGLSCTNGVCALQSGNVGTRYGQAIAISGGDTSTAPTFAIISGSLPPGLSMPATYGAGGTMIAGTPTQSGSYTFTIRGTDAVGAVAQQAYSIRIDPPSTLTITFPTTCCPGGTVGTSYLQNFFLSGGVGPYTWSIAQGQLPPGLHLATSPSASITGTPTTPGTYTFVVKVTDSTGAQATEAGSITIS